VCCLVLLNGSVATEGLGFVDLADGLSRMDCFPDNAPKRQNGSGIACDV
jgi:hypothetical protein